MNTEESVIGSIVSSQKEYYKQGNTKDISFRKQMLSKLYKAIEQWEDLIYEALYKDLRKSYEEAYLTEISILKGEINLHLKNIDKWAKREKIRTPLKLYPSKTYIVKEPLGNALIISPWNYPVQLLLNPLIGAISAGCTAILKPSPYTPNVSQVIHYMISNTFDKNYITVVQGGRNINQELLRHRYDIIFFTGSPSLGKVVMASAAQHLTPVVLELGGKSPCVVDKSADISVAAKRIAWGKTLNSGQTCIAPDYLFLHEDIHDEFIKEFGVAIEKLHGKDIKESKHYVKMVNDAAFDRVVGYISNCDVLYGGRHDRSSRFIEPTLIEGMNIDSDVMTEEIFGPVFPIVKYKETEEVVSHIDGREKPLALYYFGDEKTGWQLISKTSSGGGCINDTIMHIANENAPFGGVGNSGMGRYHGKESFEAFSHRRTILRNKTFIDLPFRYMPYKFFKYVKKLV